MMINEEEIAAYLMNELSGEALIAFEKKMALDEELQKEVESYREVEAFLGERNWQEPTNHTKENYVKALERLQERGIPEKIERVVRKRAKSRLLYRGVAAACLAAFFVTGIALYTNRPAPTNEQLFAAYFAPEEILSSTERGVPGVGSNDHFQIEQWYKEGKYQQVIDKVDVLKASPDMVFYKGISQLATNQIGEAIVTLNQYARCPSLDAPRGYWYLGLAHLKNGERALAIEAFEKLIASGNTYKSNEVNELMQALE
ncbi:MAG: hypothetical protein AAGA66_14245 [Bacteroidota bacterium]